MTKSKLAAAVVAALAFGATSAYAQDTQAAASSTQLQDQSSNQASQSPNVKNAKKLDAVTVTGSLIPQTEIETATPVITITADQMKARGFATVAQALQQASFATGSVQGMQDTNSFTPGAETLSMFGLPVGFVKYLVDGRPMGSFPGLYNSSQTFNSISGIPMDMVDHIDVLPGGQSSLYGSDAIAGVINIVLKKHIDQPALDVRYGWYTGGGGANRRVSFADSFTVGKWNSLWGVQVDSTQPMWTRDRALTRQFNQNGTSAPIPSRDTLVLNGSTSKYIFEDPSNCGNVSNQWGGTEGMYDRPGRGYYCGSLYSGGAATLQLGSKSANLYTHNTFDVNDNLQLYGDLLYNYSEKKWSNGSNTTFWNTNYAVAHTTSGYFYDPNLDSLVTLQHTFAPEEVGGYQNIMSKEYENSSMLSFGGRGTFGQSSWNYDLGFTHSEDHLIDRSYNRLAVPFEQYWATRVLGPLLDTIEGYPEYSPNYPAMWQPISPSDFHSFSTWVTNNGKTWDNMLRGQVTNDSLFTLPGGDAGMAVVLEGGNEGWDYSPDPRLLNNFALDNGTTSDIWGLSATPGAGHRSRYAATTEFRLPLLQQLTMDISGRYDSYKVGGDTVSHGTYMLGLEYRPFDSLLLRGRYGTAFKVPTLADEFQRPSSAYIGVNDYLNCGRLGYDPSHYAACQTEYGQGVISGPLVSAPNVQSITSGNPALKPITANVWTYGLVWAPVERMSISVDYLHWDINNEVTQLSADTLSNTQYLCDIKTIDPSSATCTNAFAYLARGTATKPIDGVTLLGPILSANSPKLNLANEQVNAVTAHFSYAHGIGSWGNLVWDASYSDVLKHTTQDYVIDPKVDVLRNPNYSTDFKSKANASMTWSNNQWSSTLYVNRYGRTPNNAAVTANNYTSPGAGRLGAWILWNASVTYNPLKNLGISLQISNLFNKMPPLDRTYDGFTSSPYNSDNYNPFGRSFFLEANYKFGNPSNG